MKRSVKPVVWVLAVTWVATAAWATPNGCAERHFEKGFSAKRNLNWAAATLSCATATGFNKDHLQAWWVMAWSFAHQRDAAAAVKAFQEVIRLAAPGSWESDEAKAAIERLTVVKTLAVAPPVKVDHACGLDAVSWSADGKVVVGCRDKDDAPRPEYSMLIEPGQAPVKIEVPGTPVLAPSGQAVYLADTTGLRRWRVDNHQADLVSRGDVRFVQGGRLGSSDKVLVAKGQNWLVLDTARGQLRSWQREAPQDLKFDTSPNGRWIAETAPGLDSVVIREVGGGASWRISPLPQAYGGTATGVRFAPNSEHVLWQQPNGGGVMMATVSGGHKRWVMPDCRWDWAAATNEAIGMGPVGLYRCPVWRKTALRKIDWSTKRVKHTLRLPILPFSASGQWVLYALDDADGKGDLTLLRTTDGYRVNLTKGLGIKNDAEPIWDPITDSLYYNPADNPADLMRVNPSTIGLPNMCTPLKVDSPQDVVSPDGLLLAVRANDALELQTADGRVKAEPSKAWGDATYAVRWLPGSNGLVLADKADAQAKKNQVIVLPLQR